MPTVYCFGHISTGKLYRIKDAYPHANGYGEIIEAVDNYCGEALSTGIVLKRLGVDIILEGNWLGDNEAGLRTLDFIKKQGIDCSGVLIKKDYIGVEEIVISDNTSRTVFGRYCDLLFTTRQWEMPDPAKIILANAACADPSFGEASNLVAEIASKHKIPFIAIDAHYESELIEKSVVAIISEDFLLNKFKGKSYSEIFAKYLEKCNGLVIFTFGKDPLWYGRTAKKTMDPFIVEPLDTAGAGDAFRAGIIYGLLNGYSDEQMIKFSCAVSASVIQTSPGVINFKGMQDVERFNI